MKHQGERFMMPARILLVLALVGAALLAGGPVLADEGHEEGGHPATAEGPTITLELPPELAVGKETTLLATLSRSGGPLPGADVMFLATVAFAGTEGEVVLGRAVTDGQGVARLTYLPRSQGEIDIHARFLGDGQLGRAEVSRAVVVRPGPQLYQEAAGVRIPGIGLWLLVAVLACVWATYLTVMVILGMIARKGLAPQEERTQVSAPARITAGAGGTGHE